ncbi:MAG: WD40 repeat domain-containing protein [Chloroflexi bacterium]|nr:WD40 repeat domain-containing protein [Chloroflexota bacterium]
MILPDNAADLEEFAHWGGGVFYSIFPTSDSERLVAVTSQGVQIIDIDSFSVVGSVTASLLQNYPSLWAVSPDGQFLAYLEDRSKITLWRTSDGQQLWQREFDSSDLGCFGSSGDLEFASNASSIAIFGQCNGLFSASRFVLIRINDGELIAIEEGDASGLGVFSPDGNLILTYGLSRDLDAILVRDTYTGQIVDVLEGGSLVWIRCPRTYRYYPERLWPRVNPLGNETVCVSFSPSGDFVATSYYEGLLLWDTTNWQIADQFINGRPNFSQDGNIMLMVSDNGSTAWDIINGNQLSLPLSLSAPLLSSDNSHAAGVRYTPLVDNRRDLIGVELWDIENQVKLGNYFGYNQARFSPSGDLLIVSLISRAGDYLPPLVILVSDGTILQTLEGEVDPRFSQDGGFLATVTGDRIKVYRLPLVALIGSIEGNWPQFSPDSQFLFTFKNEKINKWELPNLDLSSSIDLQLSIRSLHFINGGNQLVEESLTGTRLLDVPNLNQSALLAKGAELFENGDYYFISYPTSIEVRATSDDSILHTLITGEHIFTVISPEGTHLAVAQTNGDISIWNLEDETIVQSFRVGDEIHAMAFSSDGNRLFATAETGYSPRLFIGWEIIDGAVVTSRVFSCERPIDIGLAISTNGNLVAYTGGEDCQTVIVKLQTNQIIQTIPDRGLNMAFSPDSSILAITGRSGGIRLWNVETSDLIIRLLENPYQTQLYEQFNDLTLLPDKQYSVSIAFSPDGRWLSRTADGEASIWGVVPLELRSSQILYNIFNDIYIDRLEPGWEDWSWDSTIDVLHNDVEIQNGTAAIELSLDPWGGLVLQYPPGLDTTGYQWLEFHIFVGEDTERRFQVYINDIMGIQINEGVNLFNRSYVEGEIILPNQWQLVRIPLEDLGAFERLVGGMTIQEYTGNYHPLFYIDSIRFVGVINEPP